MAKANRPDHAYSFLLLTRQQHHSLSTVDRNAISVSRNTFGDIDNEEKLTNNNNSSKTYRYTQNEMPPPQSATSFFFIYTYKAESYKTNQHQEQLFQSSHFESQNRQLLSIKDEMKNRNSNNKRREKKETKSKITGSHLTRNR